jgi:hypothetical protein
MGIKFYCPNGHKLNVKAFLSGKKAICPQCGAKVTVPAQSQPAPGNGEADDQITPDNGTDVSPAAADQVHAATANVIAESFATAPAAAQAAGRPATGDPVQPVRATALPTATNTPAANAAPAAFGQAAAPANPVFGAWGNSSAAGAVGFGAREPIAAPQVPMAPAAPAPGFAPVGMRDAIDEAPAAVWYVRPASGGQFGPAPGETMRAWIDEGRVAATALVWRAGWPEWRSAAATFPKLAATVAAPWTQAPGYGAAPAAPAMPVQSNPWGAAAPQMAAPLGMAPVAPAGMVMAPVQPVGMAAPAGFPVGQVLGGQVVGGLAGPTESYVGTDNADDASSRVRKRRRQQTDMTMIVSIILVVLTVVLVVVLAVVLSRQSEPEAPAAPAKSTPKVETKEKPAAKEPSKKPAPAKKAPAKKAPGKKAKPAEGMDDDSEDFG